MMQSEAAVQQEIRLHARNHQCMLWRNNNGACQDAKGRQIRYGLGNDSPQINKNFKSSDLIGITYKIVTPDMIGQPVGIFTSYEVKRQGWKFTGTDREKAQAAWLEIVKQWGGYAEFATGPHDIWGV